MDSDTLNELGRKLLIRDLFQGTILLATTTSNSEGAHVTCLLNWRDVAKATNPKRNTSRLMTALEAFSASFANEHVLPKAVIALLEQMPGILSIRDTHGSSEYGTDIIFETEDPISGRILQGCVIKNLRISGSVSENNGARNVFFQAEQTLDTERLKKNDATSQRVQKILIVSPFECSAQAIQSIQGKLVRTDKIRFLCGRDLWDLFAKFHSDYVAFHTDSLARFATTVIESLDKEEAVQEALRQHGFLGLPTSLRGSYVPPSFAKHFYTFYLAVQIPDTSQLDHTITKSQVDAIARNLVLTATSLSKLNISDRQFAHHARKATRVAAELRDIWNSTFQTKWNAWKVKYDASPENRKPPEPSPGLETFEIVWTGPVRDTLANVLSDFERSIQKIQNAIRGTNAISVAHGEGSETGSLDAAELEPYSRLENMSFLYPSKLLRERSPHFVKRLNSHEIDDLQANLLISGPPGMGKTSYCKWGVMNNIERLRSGESRTVSLYVPMYRVASRGISSFEKTFFFDQQTEKLWKTRASHGFSFRFFLDGLDEIADVGLQQRALELILAEKRNAGNLSIVVTGRDYVGVPALAEFVRVSLEKFDDLQLELFITSWFKGEPEADRAFRLQLDSAPDLRELMRVPLLGTLITKVQQSMRSLPSSRTKLYEMFVGLLAGGWDFAKQVNRGSKFGPEPKIAVLAHLADRLQEERKREFNESDFKKSVKFVLPHHAADAAEILGEINRDGLIVTEGRYSGFVHHSFQEYLVATFLMEIGGDRARQVMRRYLSGDDWWGEVAKFAVALSKNPQATLGYIRKTEDYLVCRKQSFIVKPRVKELFEALQRAYPGSVSNELIQSF